MKLKYINYFQKIFDYRQIFFLKLYHMLKEFFTRSDCDCDFLSQQMGCMGFNIIVHMKQL